MNEIVELSNQLETAMQFGSSVVDTLSNLILDIGVREADETTCEICRCDF